MDTSVLKLQKNKIFFLFVLTLIIISFDLKAQVTQVKLLDIAGGLNDGTIQATIIPALTVDTIEKIFDGNSFTEAGVQNSDSLIITLNVDDPVEISKSKVFFWNNGEWTLEAANSENDLNNQTGSYQLLVDNAKYTVFKWDSLEFTANEAKFISLTARNNEYDGVFIGEWELYTPITLTSFLILPDHPKLVPGTSLQLKVKALDDKGNAYPYNLKEQVIWSSRNPAVVSVGEMGDIHARALGTSLITATTSALSGSTTVEVVSDFKSTNAQSMTIKVALVLQDPVIDSTNMRKIHQVRGWTNPLTLVNQLLEEFSQTSDGVIQFQIVETHDDEGIFTRLDGELMTIDTLAYYYSSLSRLYGRNVEGTLQNLAEVQGRVAFDYNAMIDYYDLATKRNNDEINEVWVYAPPFAGMYESQLVGPNAFWWNSPPLNHPGLEKLLSIMGWNYERGVAEALHSFGHRAESAMVHAYGDRWNVHAENPTNWEIFTRIDKELPGKAHVGNIHFPPNGMSDYDYTNRRYVTTYADNWKRYPILLDQTRSINCQEWGCSHLGYMRWWLNHLPRYTGVTDGVLNNWWHYVVDYEGAVEEAIRLTAVDDENNLSKLQSKVYSLEQNYPNPFNPVTTIKYALSKQTDVTLKVYNMMGQEVRTLVNKNQARGSYIVIWDGKNDVGELLTSGIYFYKLEAGDSFKAIHKMLLLK